MPYQRPSLLCPSLSPWQGTKRKGSKASQNWIPCEVKVWLLVHKLILPSHCHSLSFLRRLQSLSIGICIASSTFFQRWEVSVTQPFHRHLVSLKYYFSTAPRVCSSQTTYHSLKALSEFMPQFFAFFHLKSHLPLRRENHIVSRRLQIALKDLL